MSNDVNHDIQKAIQAADSPAAKNQGRSPVIPPPKALQHSLDMSNGAVLSSPKTLIAEVSKEGNH